jgi:hypothetical protein
MAEAKLDYVFYRRRWRIGATVILAVLVAVEIAIVCVVHSTALIFLLSLAVLGITQIALALWITYWCSAVCDKAAQMTDAGNSLA